MSCVLKQSWSCNYRNNRDLSARTEVALTPSPLYSPGKVDIVTSSCGLNNNTLYCMSTLFFLILQFLRTNFAKVPVSRYLLCRHLQWWMSQWKWILPSQRTSNNRFSRRILNFSSRRVQVWWREHLSKWSSAHTPAVFCLIYVKAVFFATPLLKFVSLIKYPVIHSSNHLFTPPG